MNNQQIEIVELFEKTGMAPDLIAAELQMEVGAIKAVLLQFSSVYKKANKKLERELVSEDMLRELIDRRYQMALYGESETARGRAQEFLINEALGRNDVELKKLEADQKSNGTTININKFNILINRAAAAKAKALGEKIALPAPPPRELEVA